MYAIVALLFVLRSVPTVSSTMPLRLATPYIVIPVQAPLSGVESDSFQNYDFTDIHGQLWLLQNMVYNLCEYFMFHLPARPFPDMLTSQQVHSGHSIRGIGVKKKILKDQKTNTEGSKKILKDQ